MIGRGRVEELSRIKCLGPKCKEVNTLLLRHDRLWIEPSHGCIPDRLDVCRELLRLNIARLLRDLPNLFRRALIRSLSLFLSIECLKEMVVPKIAFDVMRDLVREYECESVVPVSILLIAEIQDSLRHHDPAVGKRFGQRSSVRIGCNHHESRNEAGARTSGVVNPFENLLGAPRTWVGLR